MLRSVSPDAKSPDSLVLLLPCSCIFNVLNVLLASDTEIPDHRSLI